MNQYYSVISGVLLALPLAVSGIFMGILVDRCNRKIMICSACIIWSLSSFLTGYVTNFYFFVGMRIILGVASSVCNTAAYSLIFNYFPHSYLATANSIYSSGIYVGQAVSSLTIILINAYGWRMNYEITGIAGIVFGVFGILLLIEPKRN